jgi:SAM-dependent methyltransferase
MRDKPTNDLFKGAAQYYSRYRPALPEEIGIYLKKRYNLDGKGVLLDMGCGTGLSTFALAGLFEKTIAFDPDPEMLSEAKRLQPLNLNIEWQLRSDRDLTTEEGPYRLAIASRSFNWMDQNVVLKKLHKVLEIGGGVALIGDGSFWTGDELWQKEIKVVIQGFLGQERKAGKSNYSAPTEPYTVTLSKNGYKDVHYYSIPITRVWNIQSILGYLYSTSFSAKHLYGERLLEFEETMKERLLSLNNGVPVAKNPCPINNITKRQQIKEIIASLDVLYPPTSDNILHALSTPDTYCLWNKNFDCTT